MTRELEDRPKLASEEAEAATPEPAVEKTRCTHVTGRLPGQGAFTTFGCDLTTGEPLYEMAGMGEIHR